jgi:hypothetical protein
VCRYDDPIAAIPLGFIQVLEYPSIINALADRVGIQNPTTVFAV